MFLLLQAGAPLTEGVEVALDPSELELDPAAMQARLVSIVVDVFLKHKLTLALQRSESCFSPPVKIYFFVSLYREFIDISRTHLDTSMGHINFRSGSNCHKNAHPKMRVFHWNKPLHLLLSS